MICELHAGIGHSDEVGVGGSIDSDISADQGIRAGRRIPLSKLPDAPYLPGRVCSKIRFSNPWVTGVAAQRVAELRGIPVENVCKAAAQNCRDLYKCLLDCVQ